MKLKYLLKNISYDICFNIKKNENNIIIEKICLDSREVSKNSIFLCNNKTTLDSINSHFFIEKAINNGASVIFLNYYVFFIKKYNNVVFFICNCLMENYSFFFLNFFSFYKNKINLLSVTGTNCKTTNCHYINRYINNLFFVSLLNSTIGIYKKEKKIFSSKMTTPNISFLFDFLFFFIKKENFFLVLENSSHSIFLRKNYCLKFYTFSLTNIDSDHLDFHFDNKDYYFSKLNLELYIKRNGFLILNYKYKVNFKILNNLIFWEKTNNKKHDVFLENITDYYYYKKIIINILGKKVFFLTKFYGLLNLDNLLSFISSILPFNYDEDILYKTINDILNIQGRFNRIYVNYFFNFPLIFIDFAHNLKSLFFFLKYVKLNFKKKIISLIGLGGQRDFLKRNSFFKIIIKNSFYSIITSDSTRNEFIYSIFKDFLNNHYFSNNYCIILNRVTAIKKIIELSDLNSVILIIGRGHENEINLDSNLLKFNDLEAVLSFLKKYYD